MNRYRLSMLADDLAQIKGSDDVEVTGVANHSENVQPGDLYLALQGAHHHGLDFLSDVVVRGANAVFWEGSEATGYQSTIPMIRVPNLSVNMGFIADKFFDHPSATMDVIAVTGTDGKSSVSHFIAEGLSHAEQQCGLIGTLGYGCFGDLQVATHTTPDALTMQRIIYELKQRAINKVVIEASSHGLAQGRLNGLTIDTAVFTNLGRDHLDYHGSLTEYMQAKRKLFEFDSLKTAVINADDAHAEAMIHACHRGVTVLSYSKKSSAVAAYLLKAEQCKQGLALRISVLGRVVDIETCLFGEFNIYNLLATMLVLISHGLSIDEASERLRKIHIVDGRMQYFGGNNAPTVFVDYAHTPQALQQALKASKDYATGDLICVFGCGGERDSGKRLLMGEVASHHANYIIICDDNPRREDAEQICNDILKGVAKTTKHSVIHDRAQAITTAIKTAKPTDVVLVAGKGHERYQLVGTERKPFNDADFIQKALEDYQWHG